MFKSKQQKLREEVVRSKIKKGLHDIAEAQVFIDFYLSQQDKMIPPENESKEAAEARAKKSAQMDLKIDQLNTAIQANLEFINYAKEL